MITWCRAWQRRREEQRGRRWGRKGSRSPTRWGRSRQRGSPGQDCDQLSSICHLSHHCRHVHPHGQDCEDNGDDCHQYAISFTSKTELNMLTRTSRVVMRRPLRLAMSSLGKRKLDQETATKNPEWRNDGDDDDEYEKNILIFNLYMILWAIPP